MTIFISLGRHCQAAHQIDRAAGPGRPAQFFDWLTTPHEALLALIENGFGGFLAPANLLSRGAHEGFHYVIDKVFGVEILHDFPLAESVEARLAQVQAKYAHLARRFLELPGGADHVFIRQVEHYDDQKARALYAVLAARFRPGFKLLVASDEAAPDAPFPDILTIQIPRTDPYIWSGSDGAWDGAFAAALNDP